MCSRSFDFAQLPFEGQAWLRRGFDKLTPGWWGWGDRLVVLALMLLIEPVVDFLDEPETFFLG
jgi:hypothetical protein